MSRTEQKINSFLDRKANQYPRLDLQEDNTNADVLQRFI